MSDSELPPPSDEPVIPGESSNAGLYLVGTLVMALGAAGLLYWRFTRPAPSAPVVAPQTVVQAASVQGEPPAPLHALPPPPKLDDSAGPGAGLPKGAGATESASGAAPAVSAGADTNNPNSPKAANPCAACGDGIPSAALAQAAQAAAQSAQGCYRKAKSGDAAGSLELRVSIGANGAVCSASVTKDTVGSPEISACALGKYQGRTFPAPTQGCVVINVPLKIQLQ